MELLRWHADRTNTLGTNTIVNVPTLYDKEEYDDEVVANHVWHLKDQVSGKKRTRAEMDAGDGVPLATNSVTGGIPAPASMLSTIGVGKMIDAMAVFFCLKILRVMHQPTTWLVVNPGVFGPPGDGRLTESSIQYPDESYRHTLLMLTTTPDRITGIVHDRVMIVAYYARHILLITVEREVIDVDDEPQRRVVVTAYDSQGRYQAPYRKLLCQKLAMYFGNMWGITEQFHSIGPSLQQDDGWSCGYFTLFNGARILAGSGAPHWPTVPTPDDVLALLGGREESDLAAEFLDDVFSPPIMTDEEVLALSNPSAPAAAATGPPAAAAATGPLRPLAGTRPAAVSASATPAAASSTIAKATRRKAAEPPAKSQAPPRVPRRWEVDAEREQTKKAPRRVFTPQVANDDTDDSNVVAEPQATFRPSSTPSDGLIVTPRTVLASQVPQSAPLFYTQVTDSVSILDVDESIVHSQVNVDALV